METASIVLSKHPRKAEIEIIIDPFMREGLRSASSLPDENTISNAQELFEDFKSVDTSLISDQDWLIKTLPEKDRRAIIDSK
jgi:hypothetical protein